MRRFIISDHCGAIRAEKPLGIGLRVRRKSAPSRKGEHTKETYFMLLPDLFFPSVVVIGSCVMRKGSVYMGKMPTRMGSLTI